MRYRRHGNLRFQRTRVDDLFDDVPEKLARLILNVTRQKAREIIKYGRLDAPVTTYIPHELIQTLPKELALQIVNLGDRYRVPLASTGTYGLIVSGADLLSGRFPLAPYSASDRIGRTVAYEHYYWENTRLEKRSRTVPACSPLSMILCEVAYERIEPRYMI